MELSRNCLGFRGEYANKILASPDNIPSPGDKVS